MRSRLPSRIALKRLAVELDEERHPKRQFSVKVGTIFEDSPITLDKWLATIWHRDS